MFARLATSGVPSGKIRQCLPSRISTIQSHISQGGHCWVWYALFRLDDTTSKVPDLRCLIDSPQDAHCVQVKDHCMRCNNLPDGRDSNLKYNNNRAAEWLAHPRQEQIGWLPFSCDRTFHNQRKGIAAYCSGSIDMSGNVVGYR